AKCSFVRLSLDLTGSEVAWRFYQARARASARSSARISSCRRISSRLGSCARLRLAYRPASVVSLERELFLGSFAGGRVHWPRGSHRRGSPFSGWSSRLAAEE